MNRNYVLPQVDLSSDLSALRRVDFCAHQAYKGHGFLAIQDLPRVAEEVSSIESGDGFQWDLGTHFEESPGSKPSQIMNLALTGRLHLVCQRCLKGRPIELTEKRKFVFVTTEAEADNFPIEDDQQEPLVASQHFDILGVIEDEILLSLPLIPKHSDNACEAHQPALAVEAVEFESAEKPENPFNILKNMKKKP